MREVDFFDDIAKKTPTPHQRTTRAVFFTGGGLRGVAIKTGGGLYVADAWLDDGDDEHACGQALCDMVLLRYGWSHA